MRAVLVKEGTTDLCLGTAPELVLRDGELLIDVKATALNRADLLQKRGLYPPPPGASQILGLEMAGVIAEVGKGVSGWQPGDRVMALLAGGGYAERVTIPAGMAMRIPENLSFAQAAAIPEAFITAYLAVFKLGGLQSGQTVLIHAAASGVGTAAIQLIFQAGARSIVTAGGDKKLNACLALGASAAIDRRDGAFADKVKTLTGGNGVNIILDSVGANYWHQNIESLAMDGRIVIIATMSGGKVDEFDLRKILTRRLQVIGTTLRARPLGEKVALTTELANFALPRFADGRLVAVVDKIYNWRDANDAHKYMEENLNIGKIVLTID